MDGILDLDNVGTAIECLQAADLSIYHLEIVLCLVSLADDLDGHFFLWIILLLLIF
jgi:hypothetical protein